MKKLLTTPRSRVRSAIRQLWLRSRERAAALKRDNYTCQTCGKKQCTTKGREQKVEVHHCHGVAKWDKIIDMIFTEILCDPYHLETICPDCHKMLDVCKVADEVGL